MNKPLDHESALLTTTKALKLIHDKLHQLYEQWFKEKELFLTCCQDLEALLEHYKTSTEQFTQVPTEVMKELKQSIQSARNEMSLTLKQNLIEQAHQEIGTIGLQLKLSAEKAERALLAHERALSYERTQLKIIGITFLTAIATGCLVAWFFIPKPLTPEQITYLHQGEILNKVLPKLTKKELGHFKQLIQEVN